MELYGLLGEKLVHSLSPKIHEPIFKELNIEGKYNLFSIKRENFSKAIESLKTLGVKAVNVTIPYKEEVMEQLDFISEEAKKIGSVNTIFIEDGLAKGYNTDYYGFYKMLERENVTIKGKEFYVLGAGGASKAIIHCLLDNAASKVTLVSRDKKQGREKFKAVNIEVIDYEDLKIIENSYGIINTTPCGMYPNVETTAVDKEILKKFKVACDIVYNPEETKFLKISKEIGLKTVGGLFMLVGQAVKAEEIWNKKEIKAELQEQIYEELRGEFKK